MPCHRFGPLQSGLNGSQQRTVPVVFQDTPAAFDQIVLAVIRWVVCQFQRQLVSVREINQTLHELRSGTGDFRAVVQIDQQPTHAGMCGLAVGRRARRDPRRTPSYRRALGVQSPGFGDRGSPNGRPPRQEPQWQPRGTKPGTTRSPVFKHIERCGSMERSCINFGIPPGTRGSATGCRTAASRPPRLSTSCGIVPAGPVVSACGTGSERANRSRRCAGRNAWR